MGGIVIELQREALDEKISIESLIRKAYLVAKKLKLKEFEEWLNQEQNGYKKEIPEYRNITGEIKAWNPYHGWIPMILPAKVADIASRMPIPNSISSLLDVYNSSEDRVAFSVNWAMTEFFNNSIYFDFSASTVYSAYRKNGRICNKLYTVEPCCQMRFFDNRSRCFLLRQRYHLLSYSNLVYLKYGGVGAFKFYCIF